jgi:hypothetical protein
VHTTTRRSRFGGAGLGTLTIGSAVTGDEVVITYEIPGPARSTTSRGSTLDREPAPAGSLLTEATTSSRYETGFKVSDLGQGDHIYTVAATIDGRIISGSTIFTIPAV